MTAPMRSTLRALVMGATGAAGAEVVRQCLADSRFTKVTAITRRPLDVRHEKLEVVQLPDFKELATLGEVFAEQDVCFCALGISQIQVKERKAYREINYDYPLAVARALNEWNPRLKFIFVSGQGTDPTGRSAFLFARVKGEAERDLRALYGDRLTVLRPAYIRPVRRRDGGPWIDRVLRPIARVVGPFLPNLVVSTVQLSHAMMQAALFGGLPGVLENHEIRRAAKRYTRA